MKSFLVALLVCGSLIAVEGADPASGGEVFAMHEFAGDLIQPFGERSAYGTTQFPYVAIDSLPTDVRTKLATVTRGLTRAQVIERCDANGGLTANEFFLRGVTVEKQVVSMRIAFRPAGMAEATYVDPKLRNLWIAKHQPEPSPKDLVMRISKPFLSHYVID